MGQVGGGRAALPRARETLALPSNDRMVRTRRDWVPSVISRFLAAVAVAIVVAIVLVNREAGVWRCAGTCRRRQSPTTSLQQPQEQHTSSSRDQPGWTRRDSPVSTSDATKNSREKKNCKRDGALVRAVAHLETAIGTGARRDGRTPCPHPCTPHERCTVGRGTQGTYTCRNFLHMHKLYGPLCAGAWGVCGEREERGTRSSPLSAGRPSRGRGGEGMQMDDELEA